jgi:hypothetical protein
MAISHVLSHHDAGMEREASTANTRSGILGDPAYPWDDCLTEEGKIHLIE